MTIRELCIKIMLKYPATRDDDKMLFYIASVYCCNQNGIDIQNMTFKDVILNQTLPNFETIRRTRQKLQEQFPEKLGPINEEVKMARKGLEYYANETRGEVFGEREI